MEYQEWKKKKERSDNAWTGIIILAFICFLASRGSRWSF